MPSTAEVAITDRLSPVTTINAYSAALSVSTLVDGLAVTLVDGSRSRSRSHALPGISNQCLQLCITLQRRFIAHDDRRELSGADGWQPLATTYNPRSLTKNERGLVFGLKEAEARALVLAMSELLVNELEDNNWARRGCRASWC
jgi:hypothetical protein